MLSSRLKTSSHMSQTVPGSKWWFVSVIGTSGLDSLTSNQKEVGRMIVDLKRCLTGEEF